MFSEEFLKIAPSDQSEFGSVINYLLLKGFVVRDIFDPKEKVMRTSEYYRFIERHFDLINDYLNTVVGTLKTILFWVLSL